MLVIQCSPSDYRLTNATNAFMIGLFGGCAKSYKVVTGKGRCSLSLTEECVTPVGPC